MQDDSTQNPSGPMAPAGGVPGATPTQSVTTDTPATSVPDQAPVETPAPAAETPVASTGDQPAAIPTPTEGTGGAGTGVPPTSTPQA